MHDTTLSVEPTSHLSAAASRVHLGSTNSERPVFCKAPRYKNLKGKKRQHRHPDHQSKARFCEQIALLVRIASGYKRYDRPGAGLSSRVALPVRHPCTQPPSGLGGGIRFLRRHCTLQRQRQQEPRPQRNRIDLTATAALSRRLTRLLPASARRDEGFTSHDGSNSEEQDNFYLATKVECFLQSYHHFARGCGRRPLSSLCCAIDHRNSE